MALDRALAEGRFEGWDLAGMGTVAARGSELILPRSGRSLRLIPRSSQAEYAELLRSADVGLSLMYTPHPSLPPIEMAAAGMPTVTNTYENKDAAALAGISANLIAAEPTVEGVARRPRAEAEAPSEQLESGPQAPTSAGRRDGKSRSTTESWSRSSACLAWASGQALPTMSADERRAPPKPAQRRGTGSRRVSRSPERDGLDLDHQLAAKQVGLIQSRRWTLRMAASS